MWSGALKRLKALRLPSFAKVNLGLEVLGTRADGYHELRTIFQTITLHDDLELRPHASRDRGPLRSPGRPDRRDEPRPSRGGGAAAVRGDLQGRRRSRSPSGSRWRAAWGAEAATPPLSLIGLDRLWRLGLGAARPPPARAPAGRRRPFLPARGYRPRAGPGRRGVPAAAPGPGPRGGGRSGPSLVHRGGLPTTGPGLTPRENANNIFRFVSSQLEGQGGAFPGLSNDLERAALEEDPDLEVLGRDIRGILIREGAVFASLSGSGAAYFGVFSDAGGAQRARSALMARGFRAIRGRTLSLDRYRRMLSQPLAAPSARSGTSQGRSGHHGDHGRQGHSRRR